MLPFYVKLPYWFNQLASSLNREPATFGLYQFCTFFMCALVMIVPTILQGITLPAAIKVLVPDIRRLGRRIGYAYAINTVGTLVGSVGAGFLGLPLLGIKGTLELAVALNSVLGLAVVCDGAGAGAAGGGAWPAAVAGRRSPSGAGTASRWARGTGRCSPLATTARDSASRALKRFARRGCEPEDAVLPRRHRRHDRRPGFHAEPSRERMLVINGKTDASTGGDMPTQKMHGAPADDAPPAARRRC